MRWRELKLLLVLVGILLLVSCSSSGSPVSLPDDPRDVTSNGSNPHLLWGLWDVIYDMEANNLEFIPIRTTDFHLNVLPFLEPPPLLNVTLETDPIFDPVYNTVEVNVGLTHPFLGLTEFAGFDVKGIVISRADYPGLVPSNDLKMPGPNRRLLNPDGYTRMWNPDEFPYNPDTELFCYKDGLLGAPDSFGKYDAQINGYKYFCDGLHPGDPVTAMDFAQRGVFNPGSKNVRTYRLSMPQGLIFQYAVDASWEFPQGPGPLWTIPDDYPITANCPEAYLIDYKTDGVMFAGDVPDTFTMEIFVYDHQPGTVQEVNVEASELYTGGAWAAAYEYSTALFEVWSVALDNKNLAPDGTYQGLISVRDADVGVFPPPYPVSTHFTAYQVFNIEVLPAPGIVVTLEEDADMKGAPYFQTTAYDYDAVYFDTVPIHDCGYFINPDGPWDFSYVYTDVVSMGPVDAQPPDPEVAGFAGLYPSQVTHFWKGAFNFGPNTFQPYLGEYHNFGSYRREVYGVTENLLLGGTYIFTDAASQNVPMEFIYPYYYGTDFETIGQYIYPGPPVPFEVFELKWRVRGVGEGSLTLAPGGTTYNALLMRNDITIQVSNSDFAYAIVYEWLIDDGHMLAMIASGESPGNWNNFDHPSGFIYGDSIYMVSQDY